MDEVYDSCEEVSTGSEASASELGDEEYLQTATEAAPRNSGCVGYTTLSPDHLQSVQGKALSDVASVLACSQGIARTLLIYFRWDVEKLFGRAASPATATRVCSSSSSRLNCVVLAAFLADHDQTKLYKAAGAAAPEAASASAGLQAVMLHCLTMLDARAAS